MDQIKQMRDALRKLIKINEVHNTEIEKIIGRPLGWTDSYLDEAREALQSSAGWEGVLTEELDLFLDELHTETTNEQWRDRLRGEK